MNQHTKKKRERKNPMRTYNTIQQLNINFSPLFALDMHILWQEFFSSSAHNRRRGKTIIQYQYQNVVKSSLKVLIFNTQY